MLSEQVIYHKLKLSIFSSYLLKIYIYFWKLPLKIFTLQIAILNNPFLIVIEYPPSQLKINNS